MLPTMWPSGVNGRPGNISSSCLTTWYSDCITVGSRCIHRSLLRLLPQHFRDVKVYEVRVVEDPAFYGTFDLVALVGVGGDDVHDLGGDVVLVAEGDAAEGVAEHVAHVALDGDGLAV